MAAVSAKLNPDETAVLLLNSAVLMGHDDFSKLASPRVVPQTEPPAVAVKSGVWMILCMPLSQWRCTRTVKQWTGGKGKNCPDPRISRPVLMAFAILQMLRTVADVARCRPDDTGLPRFSVIFVINHRSESYEQDVNSYCRPCLACSRMQ